MCNNCRLAPDSEAALSRIFLLANVMVLGGLVCAAAMVLHRVDMERRLAEQMRAQFAAIVASSDEAIISRRWKASSPTESRRGKLLATQPER